MTRSKSVFKWWLSWNAERLEQWLEDQKAAGWNLVGVDFSGMVFRFEAGEPRKMAFRVDFQTRVGEDYQQLFHDAGWKLADQAASWYFWRAPFEQEKPEIFSDAQSKIDRNRRVVTILCVIMLVQLPMVTHLAQRYLKTSHPMDLVFSSLQAILMLILIGAIVKFMAVNRALKQKLPWSS